MNAFNKIFDKPNYVPKQKVKKEVVTVKVQPSKLAMSIVFESVKSLKTTTRKYLVQHVMLSKSVIDRCLTVLESEGTIKKERLNRKQTTITFIK